MLEHKPHSIFEAARAVLNRQPIEESTLKKSSDSKSDYEFVIESEGGLIEKIEESLNSIMDPKKKLEIFDKLKKGDEVHIKYIPGGVNEKGSTFTVKNKKNFAKGEQILLSKNDGNAAAKYYLYKRGSAGIVSFSLGDLGSPILDMSIKETVELEEKVGNVVINTHSPSAAKRLAKKLANKWSDLRSLTPNDKSLTVPDVRYIIRYIEIQPEFEGIVESTNKPDWSDSMLDLYIRKDRNGNKVLKVVLPDLRFNIQTNGNLPKTHSRGAGDHTIGELVKYVKSYGSTMQKNAISIYARTKIDEGVDKSSPIYKEYEELKDHSIQSRLNRENETTELEEDATTDLVKMGIGAAAGAVGLGALAKKRFGKDGRTNAKAKKLEKEADAKERLKKAQERLKNAKEGKRDAETPKQKETAKETEKNALDSVKKAKDKLKETVELSEVSKGAIAKALGGPAFANDTLYMQVFKDAGDSKKREESLGRLKKARGAEAYERTKKALKRLEDHGFKFEEVESAELQEGSDVTLESYIQTENSSWARQIKHLPGQPYIAVVKNKDGQEKYIGKTSYSDHTTALEEGSLWLKTVKNGVPQMVVERTISGFINSAVKEGKVTFK